MAVAVRALRRLPAIAVLLLVPVSLLVGGTSTAGRFAVAAVAAVLALGGAVLVAVGVLPFRRSYLWIVVLAGLLLVSFALPLMAVPAVVSTPPERHRLADLLGLDVLRGLTPTRLDRLSDLIGFLAGLALLGATVAASPPPRYAARVVALSGTVAAGYALVRGGFVHLRLEGLNCNPNYLGIVLALPLVAAVGLVRHTRGPRWLVPAAVCAYALAATRSRGAVLAAAAGVVFVIVHGHSWRVRAAFGGAGVVAAGVAAVCGVLPPADRLIGIVGNLGAAGRSAIDTDQSNTLREQVARIAVRATMDHPLRGIGYWMFPTYAQRSPDFGVYLATHNDYLRLSAEAGVPALVVFLVLLWPVLWRRRAGYPAVLRAIVVTYGASMLFANPLANVVVSTPFWVALGCLLAAGPDATGPSPPGAVRFAGGRRAEGCAL